MRIYTIKLEGAQTGISILPGFPSLFNPNRLKSIGLMSNLSRIDSLFLSLAKEH
nr:MAG TPA: Stage V sporulation protein family [Caudoviricetes sp.]